VDDAHPIHDTTYVVNENAQLFYSLICVSGKLLKNIHLSFIVERNALVRVELLIAHTNVHVEVSCIMRGESGSMILNGAYLLRESNSLSVQTKQLHEAAHTNSKLVMRGIVDDSAQVFYSGMIRVEKHARCSVSSQENKNVLLSDMAKAVSVPSLEVLTNDVHCFHGSAIGKFNQDYLFYAASRGIDEKQMQRLLIHAFFVNMFENNEVVQVLKGLI